MSSEHVIQVTNLSKCYQIYNKPHERLLQTFSRGRKQYGREFWALKNVSFVVKKGETVGIIGRNGSGKSTLLQMISGTLKPTEGTIKTQGRVAALLELGTSFNMEFTGRENVYVNATILGLNKEEIDNRFDDIAAFADIGDFIDQPVKMYSSGMVVRLAFAVQAQVEPDIFIVDEALAVGDAKFQAKCFARLKRLRENGTSILLVTHASDQIITHCSHAILLNNGIAVEMGSPNHVVNCYMDLMFGKTPQKTNDGVSNNSELAETKSESNYELSTSIDIFSTHPGYNPYEYRWGDGAAKILDFYIEADQKPYPFAVLSGQRIKLRASIHFLADLVRPIFGVTIKTKEGVIVYGANSETLEVAEYKNFGQKGKVIECEVIFQCNLAQGDYFISLGISTLENGEVLPHDRRYDSIHIHVLPSRRFFGLADLNFSLTAQEI